jgi:hypothetical protein
MQDDRRAYITAAVAVRGAPRSVPQGVDKPVLLQDLLPVEGLPELVAEIACPKQR